MFITPQEILMGRDAEYPLTEELRLNLNRLLLSLNRLRAYYGKPMVVSSGYRPGKYNKAAGGAAKSAHLTCEACDFRDIDGSLDLWCMANQDKLEECGLWLEHPDATSGWCHLDIRKRNNRVFRP